MKYPEIVENTKRLFCGNGTPLIKPGKYTDEYIDIQVSMLMDDSKLTDLEYRAIVKYCVDNNFDKKESEKQLLHLIGWETKPDDKFWEHSGSIILKKEYFKGCSGKIPSNAIGFDEAFPAEKRESFFRKKGFFWQIVNDMKEYQELKKSKELMVSRDHYMFDTAKEYLLAIQNAKKTLENDAIAFFRDPKNKFEDRLVLFNELGGKKDFIFHPKDKNLNRIFEMFHERDYLERYQSYHTWDVIEWWIRELKPNRCKIDFSRNQYHPSLIKTKRNYQVSQEALNRLQEKYLNLLIAEGISEFIFDW